MTKLITSDDLCILKDFFSSSTSVSDELIHTISQSFIKRIFKKGEVITKEGDIECYANIVTKGVVHQFMYDEDAIITINITPARLGFNSLKSYIESSPSLEVHEALTDVEVLSIRKQDIDELVKSDAAICYLLYKVHEHILLDRENRMLMLQYRSAEKRLQLFHEIIQRSDYLLANTPDKYIASYLNMTPQQYSKEKSKRLKRQG
ncbi:Crp/Fnr family transcriptional regulator [Saccharicrinis aurantiacus]|uniref:Crp/Fnr family transcriptional regulator n=1 Tax=Saccharicrinis aurantiacus TaxID=1849719 RepID=UPI00094FA066|nr:Crp/Fnr family transcriptional regulator [Saccharicrinis aurantiacus]